MWQTELPLMIRHLIDDISTSPIYSDSRLSELVIVCAQFIKTENILRQTYSVDVDSLILSPDPTLTSNRDDDFIGLLALKAAAILTAAEAKTGASQAFAARDAGAFVDFKGVAQHKQLIAKDFQDRYEKYRLNYLAGNSLGCRALLTPFRLNYPSLPFNPSNPLSSYKSLY